MISHLHYRSHLRHFANREMLEMFLFQVLKELAFGLVNIYVPVYLYLRHVPLFYILAVFTLQSAVHGLIALFAGRAVLLKIGLKRSFVIANILFIGSFIVLQHGVTWPLLVTWAILNGGANAIYASTYHSYLALTIDRGSAGKEIAWLAIFVTLADTLTPFIGALAILAFGFKNMFTIGALLLLASVVPLFFSSDIDLAGQVVLSGLTHLKEFWRAKRKIAWSAVGNGLDGSSNPLWDSLYLFKLLGSIEFLGALTSVVSLLQIISNYIGGRRLDKNQSAFSVGISGSILARMLTFASFYPYVAIMSETLNYAIKPLFSTAYNATFYKQLKSSSTVSLVVAHENTWHAANVGAMVVVTAGSYFFGWYAFLITGVFMIIGKIIIRSQRVGASELPV